MSHFLDKFQDPEVAHCPVDGLARFEAHRAVLRSKDMIRAVFNEFHDCFTALDRRYFSGTGLTIELGAGVYPVSETVPGVLATDVVAAPHIDRELDAGDMALEAESVRAFYLQNVFHHFPDPARFFGKLQRTLVPGGGAILVEPASGLLTAPLYPRLFATESYDKWARDWEAPVGGQMSGANQALSYVVFDRDLARFERDFPRLEVVHRDVLPNWPRYLLSGGLNFRSLVPGFAAPAVRAMEWMLGPLRRVLGLHRVIVLRKRTEAV